MKTEKEDICKCGHSKEDHNENGKCTHWKWKNRECDSGYCPCKKFTPRNHSPQNSVSGAQLSAGGRLGSIPKSAETNSQDASIRKGKGAPHIQSAGFHPDTSSKPELSDEEIKPRSKEEIVKGLRNETHKNLYYNGYLSGFEEAIALQKAIQMARGKN